MDGLRDWLFGDTERADSNDTEQAASCPSLKQARLLLVQGDVASANRALESIAADKSSSLNQLQAWSLLRRLGKKPPKDVGENVLCVVVEVGMKNGLDMLATYEDGRVRYYNFSGREAFWDHPNNALDTSIAKVLDVAKAILPRIGTWEGPKRPAPMEGVVRLNILTPVGLHFGEGPFDLLARDAIGGPLVKAATTLMRQMTAMFSERRT